MGRIDSRLPGRGGPRDEAKGGKALDFRHEGEYLPDLQSNREGLYGGTPLGGPERFFRQNSGFPGLAKKPETVG
jgi:hypothetical protein